MRRLFALLAALALLLPACALRPIVTELPEGATPEQRYYALLHDYQLLIEDASGYMALPTTALVEAEAVHAVLTRTDAQLKAFDERRRAGQVAGSGYSIAGAAIEGAVAELCLIMGSDAPTACAARGSIR